MRDLHFRPIPSDEEHGMTDQVVLEDIIISKYRVLYGYRLRAGFIEYPCCELDIWCGAKKEDYDTMDEKIRSIIVHNIKNNKDPFQDIPRFSIIKPYFNDEKFLAKIEKLYLASLKWFAFFPLSKIV